MHLSTSLSTGKAPMDLAALRVALASQGFNVLPQMLKAFDAFGQTATLEDADLDLGHVEPGFRAWAYNVPPIVAKSVAPRQARMPRRGIVNLAIELNTVLE